MVLQMLWFFPLLPRTTPVPGQKKNQAWQINDMADHSIAYVQLVNLLKQKYECICNE